MQLVAELHTALAMITESAYLYGWQHEYTHESVQDVGDHLEELAQTLGMAETFRPVVILFTKGEE